MEVGAEEMHPAEDIGHVSDRSVHPGRSLAVFGAAPSMKDIVDEAVLVTENDVIASRQRLGLLCGYTCLASGLLIDESECQIARLRHSIRHLGWGRALAPCRLLLGGHRTCNQIRPASCFFFVQNFGSGCRQTVTSSHTWQPAAERTSVSALGSLFQDGKGRSLPWHGMSESD